MTTGNAMITIPATAVPVRGDCDVLVGGSGSAGICAALAAARSGARTVLLEAQPIIGGTAASGLPLLTTNDTHGKQLSRGLLAEILDLLRAEGSFAGDLARESYFCYDVEKYRLVVSRLLAVAGVQVCTSTTISGVVKQGAHLSHVLVQQKEGAGAYAARAFVDCTGDADIAWRAGEPMQGHDIDGLPQPPTLLFFMANVDEAALTGDWWGRVQARFEELRPTARWRNPRSGPAQSPAFRYPGKPGFLGFNVTRTLGIDATLTADLVRMEQDQREQVDEYVYRFLIPHIPGFARAYLAGCAAQSGIRETRRIRGDFVLTREPLDRGEEFPDAIAWSSYPIDRHSPRQGSTVFTADDQGRRYYSLPLRVLVPALTPNLLVAGRCISADEMAFSAVRVMGTTMPLGEAAGIAAALIARHGMAARAVPAAAIRGELAARGALVER